MSEEVANYYTEYGNLYAHMATNKVENAVEKKRLFACGDMLTSIAEKLKDITFKEKMMKECANKFHDPHFSKKLDSKNNLIGFENGVYELPLTKKDEEGNKHITKGEFNRRESNAILSRSKGVEGNP